MIGIVIVTHEKFGEVLIDAASYILGSRPEAVAAVAIDPEQNAETLRKRIANGLKAVNRNKGILILTDMFGGTPSNMSYSFLEEGRIEVLTGVNLPILIKALTAREKSQLNTLATELQQYGRESIALASSILKGNKRGVAKMGKQMKTT